MPIRYSSVVGGSGSSGFNLDIGSSGNTTFVFDEPQPAGGYSITSQLADSTIEFYAIAEDGSSAGYTNSKSLTASKDFDTLVVYGATNNDLITFEFKPTTIATSNGDQDSGAGPFLTSATPVTLASIDDTTTVTGGNFANNVEIVFTGQDEIDRAAKNIVRSDSTSIIVTRPDNFPIDQEPYSMTASNPGIADSSLGANRLTNYFDAGGTVTWITSSLISGVQGSEYSATLQATDADETAIEYVVTAGSLPTGLSLNSSTGVISGTPSNVETQTFTVTATDAGGNSISRDLSISIAAPYAEYLVIAGGGGGGRAAGAGGGAGGYRSSVVGESSGGGQSAETPTTIQLDTNYTVTVGAGGAGQTAGILTPSGTNSVFGSTVADGGGGAGGYNGNNTPSGTTLGRSGGSGGGTWNNNTVGSGTFGQGYDGGKGTPGPGYGETAGGGGGAGSVGTDGVYNSSNGNGGLGVVSAITGGSVRRSGGGGSGCGSANLLSGGLPGSGGGGRGGYPVTSAKDGGNAVSNTGGGGGGSSYTGNLASLGIAGNGGSGVVILRYPDTFQITSGPGLASYTLNKNGQNTTVFTSGDDTIQFTGTPAASTVADYLIIAGGGGGGSGLGAGSGGGAGGYRSSVTASGGGVGAESPAKFIDGDSYTISVGAGGSGGTGGGAIGAPGNSSYVGNLTTTGGGRGAGPLDQNSQLNGGFGGSGGGAVSTANKNGYVGLSVEDEGYPGGLASSDGASYDNAGGGGGASSAGGNASSSVSGNGGAGLSNSITGSSISRGGGGSGAAYNGKTAGTASDGGGNGAVGNSTGGSGTTNTGGGGGGSGATAGNGGSGVVILKYPDTKTLTVGPGLVSSTDSSSVPGYKITTFTSGTDTITFS